MLVFTRLILAPILIKRSTMFSYPLSTCSILCIVLSFAERAAINNDIPARISRGQS